METVRKIESKLDDLQIGWWDDENDDFILFGEMSEEDKKQFCSREDFRPILLDTLETFCISIQEKLGEDLRDIWRRMDKSER